MAVSAYNNSYHSSIKMTPYEAHFGRPSIQVVDVILNNKLPANTQYKSINEYNLDLYRNTARISEIINREKYVAQLRQKEMYDKRLNLHRSYVPGDIVKIINSQARLGHSKLVIQIGFIYLLLFYFKILMLFY